jgi:fatty-acyl-CoA synthase
MICDASPSGRSCRSRSRRCCSVVQGVHYVIADPVRVVNDDGSDVEADGESDGGGADAWQQRDDGLLQRSRADRGDPRGRLVHSGDPRGAPPRRLRRAARPQEGHHRVGRENISTIEEEPAISAHPSVAAVAVVSTPDPKWGERPKAFVELNPGEELSEDDVLAFARSDCPAICGLRRSSSSRSPRPRRARCRRRALRDKEWEGHERRVG